MQLQASTFPDWRRPTHFIGGALADECISTNAGAQTSEKEASVPSMTAGPSDCRVK